jgi:hypothetical protein
LNDNDVLLGRGVGPSHWVGNKRFRDLIDSRKAEYIAIESYNDKAVIAWEVYNEVRRRGGRFLKLSEVSKNKASIIGHGLYEEASENISLEKCKQALREKRKASVNGEDGGPGAATGGGHEGDESEAFSEPVSNGNAQASGSSAAVPNDDTLLRNALVAPVLSNVLPQASSLGIINPCLLLFQQPLMIVQQQLLLQQQQMLLQQHVLSDLFRLNSIQPNFLPSSVVTNQVYPPYAGRPSHQRDMAQNHQSERSVLECRARDILFTPTDQPELSSQRSALFGGPPSSHNGNVGSNEDTLLDPIISTAFSATSAAAAPPSDEASKTASEPSTEDSTLALSALAVAADRPRWTEEEEAIERASLTDEDKAAALCDLYGKYAAVDTYQKKKRPKRELDRRSIDFLIQYMRDEIERYPVYKKQALIEAQEKCRVEEFGDARLEGFLRCEGMNAKLAAERFVNYWDSRREVFGPDKFVLPLTLGRALKDDIPAIEAGVHRFLPHPDSLGRRLLFIEPHRHTRKGYTSESLVRAFWYLMEVFIDESGCDGSGFVTIVWDLNTTIYDYDSKVSDKIVYLFRQCFPLKTMPTHICCAHPLLVRILKPLMKALMNKETRQRFLVHSARPDGILGVLSEYGIPPEVLPAEMGGAIQLDQSEWIATRRAIEMEEIL